MGNSVRFRAAGGIRRDEEVSRGHAAQPERGSARKDPWIGRDNRADRASWPSGGPGPIVPAQGIPGPV